MMDFVSLISSHHLHPDKPTSLNRHQGLLMMEQPGTLLDERNPQFLRSFEDRLIVIASDRTGDILHPTPRGTVDVIDEGELRHRSIVSQVSSQI
jgi:hypothetical protein